MHLCVCQNTREFYQERRVFYRREGREGNEIHEVRKQKVGLVGRGIGSVCRGKRTWGRTVRRGINRNTVWHIGWKVHDKIHYFSVRMNGAEIVALDWRKPGDFLVWLAGELFRTKASQRPERLWVLPSECNWLHLAPRFLPLSYRIIPPRGWKRPMRYWKASSSLSSMPGSTFSAKVWRRREWRSSPASKPLRSTHPSPVSHHLSEWPRCTQCCFWLMSSEMC